MRNKIKDEGPTEIRTRIVGFKVQSDSHYTIRPTALNSIFRPLTLTFIVIIFLDLNHILVTI